MVSFVPSRLASRTRISSTDACVNADPVIVTLLPAYLSMPTVLKVKFAKYTKSNDDTLPPKYVKLGDEYVVKSKILSLRKSCKYAPIKVKLGKASVTTASELKKITAPLTVFKFRIVIEVAL